MLDKENLYKALLVQTGIDNALANIKCNETLISIFNNSLLDLLLYFQVYQVEPSHNFKLMFEEKFDSKYHCSSSIELIFELCNQLKMKASEKPLDYYSSKINDSLEYYYHSRAILTDIKLQKNLSKEPIEIARDTCFLIQQCKYLDAFHAIICLIKSYNIFDFKNNFEKTLIFDFIVKSKTYLKNISEIFPSNLLNWEKTLICILDFKE